MCCNEDIDRLQLSLKEILKELYSLAERIHNKKEMKSHTLPTSLNILYLDEYFIDVAHKFNKEQRATIQNIFSEMQELNANLTSLKKRESQIDRFALSRLLSNFTLLALNTYKNCKSIKNKSQPTDSGLINELEITTDQVQSLKQIRINIINENSTLNL